MRVGRRSSHLTDVPIDRRRRFALGDANVLCDSDSGFDDGSKRLRSSSSVSRESWDQWNDRHPRNGPRGGLSRTRRTVWSTGLESGKEKRILTFFRPRIFPVR